MIANVATSWALWSPLKTCTVCMPFYYYYRWTCSIHPHPLSAYTIALPRSKYSRNYFVGLAIIFFEIFNNIYIFFDMLKFKKIRREVFFLNWCKNKIYLFICFKSIHHCKTSLEYLTIFLYHIIWWNITPPQGQ
jgi:hypothetical protein